MATTLLVVLGLVVLVAGAEALVRGGANIAARLGVAPITIGLTVVALGTSMPELAVGIDAARRGSGELAVGNIVGTNLVNLLLILGLSAAIRPIALASRTLSWELPSMTAAALLLLVVARDGELDRLEGGGLIVLGVLFTYGVLRTARTDAAARVPAAPGSSEHVHRGRLRSDLAALGGGIVALVVGADLLVRGAIDTAEALGVSDAVIGLTVIAIGTSAPELVTTLLSTFRGDRDLAVGNLIGSSVYNLVFILGATVLLAPSDIAVPDEVLEADLVLMAVVAVACVPVFVSGRRISRGEGGLFVALYAAYLTWLLATRT